MNALFRRFALVLSLTLVLILAACGGGGNSGGGGAIPTATPEPAAAAPTRTPRPTREPAPTPEVTPTPLAVLRPTAGPGEVLPVEIGRLMPYEHPSGVFRIDIPEGWDLQDNSRPDELILIWTDPTRNGGVIVDIFEDETIYTPDQLIDILETFLNNSFGSEPDFFMGDPETQGDDSILIVWSYTAEADNGVEVSLLGNSFIEQRGNKVSILTTLIPEDQFDDLVDRTDELINTYRINPDAVLTSSGGGGGSSSDGGLGGAVLGSGGDVPTTIVRIGEAVDVGNGLTMSVVGVEESAGDGFIRPTAGNTFLIVRTVFTNSSSSGFPVSTVLQMQLVGADGTVYELDIMAATVAGQTPDGEVPANGRIEGGVGFQVPTGTRGLTFVFTPIFGGEAVGVALD
ncbi:MAG: DUF4352 domain-containing protein [Oscillochloridaceae bacterium umkhey_bin13]